LLVPHDQLPPAPGVDTPLPLASTVPATVASPNTAMMTGRDPVSRSVAPLATVKLRTGMMTTSGPFAWVRTTGVGGEPPHQLPNMSVVESNVVVPQSSTVFVAAAGGLSPCGSKFDGV
jgi:hypothetical protein